jgi:hypothetical protein
MFRGAAMTAEPRTGADESTTILLDFPISAPSRSRNTHGIATTAMRVHFDHARDTVSESPTVRIQGDKGEIQVFGPIYKPQRFRYVIIHKTTFLNCQSLMRVSHSVIYAEGSKPTEVHAFDFPGGIHGMAWEGDDAARCWLAGKLESEVMPWDESIAIMEVCDEVRRLGGLKYPDNIETTQYPVDMKARDTSKAREFINRN